MDVAREAIRQPAETEMGFKKVFISSYIGKLTCELNGSMELNILPCQYLAT
jgi:hypothetical protein